MHSSMPTPRGSVRTFPEAPCSHAINSQPSACLAVGAQVSAGTTETGRLRRNQHGLYSLRFPREHFAALYLLLSRDPSLRLMLQLRPMAADPSKIEVLTLRSHQGLDISLSDALCNLGRLGKRLLISHAIRFSESLPSDPQRTHNRNTHFLRPFGTTSSGLAQSSS